MTASLQNSQEPRRAPGPQEFPPLWENPLQVLEAAQQQYGDIVCLDPHNHQIYLVSHPDYIKHVLQDNYRNYRRDADSFKLITGNGLFVSEGEYWLRQRRLMQPVFHRTRIEDFLSVMVNSTAEAIAGWKSGTDANLTIDALDEMMKLAMTIIVRTLFGTEMDDEIESAGRALTVGQEYVFEKGWDYLGEMSSEADAAFQEALNTLDTMVYRIIRERRQQGEEGDDLLAMLLQARDEETGEGMTDQQVRDEVITFFGAGRETTATAMAWTWYLLVNHPEIMQKAEAEVDSRLGDRTPTLADIPDLSYIKMVFEESMRLYPPGWLNARLSLAEDEIGGYAIPANSEIFLSPYITHRHPKFWDNPEVFDPERFSQAGSAGRPRFAYFPFGGGPRLCIGNHFAMMEAQVVIAMMIQAFNISLNDESQVKPQALLTLLPTGLQLRLSPK